MTVSQSSSVILNSMLSRVTPALLTRTTGGPSRPATAVTASDTWPAWLTSQPTASARPPAPVIASTVSWQSPSFRSRTATARPSAASRLAVAAPIPRAPPVTTATRGAWSGIRSSCCGLLRLRLAGVAAELAPGERALVHLVGPVGEAERAGAGPQVRQRRVLADPHRTVRLDGLVQHPLGHRRGDDLDGLDLPVRALVPDRVHQPGGLQHQQPGLLDPDPGLGDPVLDDALLGQRLAERDPAGDPLAHQRQGPLARADLPHAVVDPARPEPGLGDGEPLALPGDQVLRGHPHVGELDLGVPAVRPVGVAEHPHAALDVHPGG